MNGLLLAFRVSRVAPTSFIRAAAWTGAMVQWARRSRSTRRLEDNLARVTGLTGAPLRRLSRRGVASAARYYAETLELPRLTEAAIDARVRTVGLAPVAERLARDGRIVMPLAHSGNWDLVGAYACRHIAPVTSVAEVLRPREVFDQFVALREAVGMRILGHDGASTFRELVRIARSDGGLLCLVADRDLSGSGIPVDFAGHEARVAPGPAALAAATGTAVVPVAVHYERLRGARRRAAGSRWGLVLTFGPVIDPDDAPREDRVAHLTRAWVAFLVDAIRAHPEDWHMLQRFGWTR